MVSSLELTARTERADLRLHATGSAKVFQVAFKLVYTGSAPSKVLAFAAAVGKEAVQLRLSYPDAPAPFVAVVKLKGAELRIASGDDGGRSVVLPCVLAREDSHECQELLLFLLAAAAALELEVVAKIVQAPLPFPTSETEELEDPEGEGDPLEVVRAPRRRPKGSSPAP